MKKEPSEPPHVRAGDDHEDALLDEALNETFPASDPVAISSVKPVAKRFDVARPTNRTEDGASSAPIAIKRAPAADPRIDYWRTAPQGLAALRALQMYVESCGLEPSLLELMKIRASQINGCAYCIDMHTKDARRTGETDQRLYALSAWRETPFFTERERAVLAWTEAVSRISAGHVDDSLYETLRQHLTEKEIVDLTLGVVAINGWNRLAISFRTRPGGDQPHGVKTARS